MTELRATAATLSLALLAGGAFYAWLPRTPAAHPALPDVHQDGGYLGSSACRSCHPSEHESWEKTFHRSMTRRANEVRWNGTDSPSLPATLSLYGRDFHLSLKTDSSGGIRYRGPDLHAIGGALARLSQEKDASQAWLLNKAEEFFASAPEVERELVMLTGSHHYLAFWIEGGEDSELRQFPFIFLLDELRFLPRKDAFLQPPEALPHVARWNSNCIQCHAVAGKPEQTEGTEVGGKFWERYKTAVAEEGISCEACHGPGKKHVEHYRNPLTRTRDRDEEKTAHIFVPDPQAGARGSEVCGQCHSYFVPKKPDEWWASGFSQSFQAGYSLDESRALLRQTPVTDDEKIAANALDRDLTSIFWDDGSIMVGGREYNGLSKSPCFERGTGDKKLACTSCHSMHESDPNLQLSREVEGDQMCTQCHNEIKKSHSRHEDDSPGARCVSCHMPRTSYALLHGIPSHQIASPSVEVGRPPHACSLCHVDRSATWISREVAKFGSNAAPPSPTTHLLPVAVERALSGNAAERALFAYALGSHGALATAGPEVSAQLLPLLEKDPYAAVRLIAERSSRSLHSSIKLRPALGRARDSNMPPLNEEMLSELIQNRDNTPVVISE